MSYQTALHLSPSLNNLHTVTKLQEEKKYKITHTNNNNLNKYQPTDIQFIGQKKVNRTNGGADAVFIFVAVRPVTMPYTALET